MRILIVAAVPPESTRGNQITALRWQRILVELGHDVDLANVSLPDNLPIGKDEYDCQEYDCLVALHARKSHQFLARFHHANPDKPVIVCLTGTDLHYDLLPSAAGSKDSILRRNYDDAIRSLEIANRLVLLEPRGQDKLPERFLGKCTVIFQSATPVSSPAQTPDDCFLISVIGHLREVKDPFQTAWASQRLPASSRVRVIHIGDALTDEMRVRAEAEMKANPRYQWIGPVNHDQAGRYLTGSHLTVLSSKLEGAPSLISEAIVNHVPILATSIDAVTGMLGAGYLGLFPVGDTQRLAELISMAESEPEFMVRLKEQICSVNSRYSPQVEADSWKQLLDSLGV